MSREAEFPVASAPGFEPVRATAFLLDAAGLRDLVLVAAMDTPRRELGGFDTKGRTG
jgi:hypothetical protein